jgi:dipeptidyl aminopeptidase/acylaminoacyl peptidase
VKGVLVGLAVLALWCGGASAGPATTATLSFALAAGVSDFGFEPLGGGICLGSRRVTDPKPDDGAAWSPDGTRVAFYRQTGTLTADVFVVDADGSHVQNLSRGTANFSWAPTWSPDGSRIAYVASDDTKEQLVTIRPDGSDRQPIPGTAVDPNRQLRSPDWSPDGHWIGYSLTDGLHLIRPDGSDPRFLLGDALGFSWSADGARIAFTRDGDLAIAAADGTDVRFVTRTPWALEGGAEWSPDGSRLVYTSVDNAPRGVQGPGDHMYLADGDGLHRRELLGPRGAWNPAWRPAASAIRTRPCVLLGTPRADRIVGTAKGELIVAGRGNDIVHGRGGDDIIVGDIPFSSRPGHDRLDGGPGRDFIDSYDGRRDVVNGGPGRDRGMFDRHDRVRSIEKRG